jgi:hypothetical protein
MKGIYLSLSFLLLVCCINKDKGDLFLFTDELVSSWEKATIDTINNIYERNRNFISDSFYLEQLSHHKSGFYNHDARLEFIKTIRDDSTFLSSQIKNCILIEEINSESKISFKVIYYSSNKVFCLSYKLWYTTDVRFKTFMLFKKYTIDKDKLEKFIQIVRNSNLFKYESCNGEYYNGDILISIFDKNMVEVFPFLTYNFSNDIYLNYNELFK